MHGSFEFLDEKSPQRSRNSSPCSRAIAGGYAQIKSFKLSNLKHGNFLGLRDSNHTLASQSSRSGTPSKRDSIKDEGKDSGGPSQPLVKIGHYILGMFWHIYLELRAAFLMLVRMELFAGWGLRYLSGHQDNRGFGGVKGGGGLLCSGRSLLKIFVVVLHFCVVAEWLVVIQKSSYRKRAVKGNASPWTSFRLFRLEKAPYQSLHCTSPAQASIGGVESIVVTSGTGPELKRSEYQLLSVAVLSPIVCGNTAVIFFEWHQCQQNSFRQRSRSIRFFDLSFRSVCSC